MSAEIGDMQRRIANLFRVGKVAEVDRSTGRVKVQFGEAVTAWLPWMTGRAGAVRDWNPPSVGEQVVVCSPSGEVEAGFVMFGSINTATNAAPTSDENTYRIDVPAGGTFEIRVGGATLSFSGGKITTNCNIESSADVKAGSISLKTHVHGGVTQGSDPTLAPQ